MAGMVCSEGRKKKNVGRGEESLVPMQWVDSAGSSQSRCLRQHSLGCPSGSSSALADTVMIVSFGTALLRDQEPATRLKVYSRFYAIFLWTVASSFNLSTAIHDHPKDK